MTRIVVLAGFLIAFAAGLVVGLRVDRGEARPTTRQSWRGWLAAELKLNTSQQEELNKIWSDTAQRGGHDLTERRRQLSRQRDEAIAALVRPEDKPRYQAALKEHADKTAELDRQWRERFQNSIQRTKEILTPEQRAKYEEMLKKWERDHESRDRRGDRDGGRRSSSSPATQAASQPG